MFTSRRKVLFIVVLFVAAVGIAGVYIFLPPRGVLAATCDLPTERCSNVYRYCYATDITYNSSCAVSGSGYRYDASCATCNGQMPCNDGVAVGKCSPPPANGATSGSGTTGSENPGTPLPNSGSGTSRTLSSSERSSATTQGTAISIDIIKREGWAASLTNLRSQQQEAASKLGLTLPADERPVDCNSTISTTADLAAFQAACSVLKAGYGLASGGIATGLSGAGGVFNPAPPTSGGSGGGSTDTGTPAVYQGSYRITSATCGATYTFAVDGYKGSQVWLVQTKNGATSYNDIYPVPTNHTSACNRDEGIYVNTVYSVVNGTKGNYLGTGTFTVNAVVSGAAPTVTLTAAPSTVKPGESAILTWSSSNAASCVAVTNNVWKGNKPTSGSETLTPPPAPATYFYYLSCTGNGKTTTERVIVDVSTGVSLIQSQADVDDLLSSWNYYAPFSRSIPLNPRPDMTSATFGSDEKVSYIFSNGASFTVGSGDFAGTVCSMTTQISMYTHDTSHMSSVCSR